MQFFSTFPGGKPGVGLLLLRVAVGVTAIVQGGVYLARSDHSILGMWIVELLAVASGALVLIGFLTKVSGVVVGLSNVGVGLSWVPAPPLNSFDTKLTIIFVIIMAAAIILIGPGAFSLDARLFGRREIIIPPSSHSLKS
jgi:uncharacterized membrane protein YphA (DoxX/SURF4 family)